MLGDRKTSKSGPTNKNMALNEPPIFSSDEIKNSLSSLLNLLCNENFLKIFCHFYFVEFFCDTQPDLNPYPVFFGTITESDLWKKNPKSSLVTSQLGLRQ